MGLCTCRVFTSFLFPNRDGELPSDLRMVKLGVMRARYRRHCTQTKHATRINTKSMTTTRKFTLALIRLAKSSPSCASQTLSAMYGRNLQWPQDRYTHHRSFDMCVYLVRCALSVFVKQVVVFMFGCVVRGCAVCEVSCCVASQKFCRPFRRL